MATIFHACSECSHVLSSDEEFCPTHPDAMIHSAREGEYGPAEDETKALVVDPDTVSMVLSDDEYTRERSRAAIDEIARRVEAELESRGLNGYAVEREYRTTGRNDDEELPEVWEAVLIGQVNEIRAAVLGEVEGD